MFLLCYCSLVIYLPTEEWDDVEEDDSGSSECSSACGAAATAGLVRHHELGCAEGSSCRALHDLIEEEGSERLYPPLDGTAFYRKICHMNVSQFSTKWNFNLS